jgi:hypothetical protein
MHKAMLVFLLVAAMAGSAAAQCCGDCNGDGHVTIDELITAVNNALSDCGAATPTPPPTSTATVIPTDTQRPTVTPTPVPHCPFTFSDSGNLCTFSGRFNRGCGSELGSLLISNGSLVTVAIDTMLDTTPVLLFGAQVDSPTSATLTSWSTDNFETTHLTSGVIQLADNGTSLIIFPNDPPLMILSCNFVQYVGAYTGSARARSASASADGALALARLRTWLQRPLPDIADP